MKNPLTKSAYNPNKTMIEPTEFKPSFSPTEMETRYAGLKFEHWVLPICDFQLDYDALADSDGYWFDDYASHLLDEHDYDDEELCNEMWSLVRYYGGGGEEFGKWYENRSQDFVDCLEYDEWVKEYWQEKARMELAKPEEPKCWTCDEKPATHSVYRDALDENELTCDGCYNEEYPEEEPEPPSAEDWFRTNNECVCEKKPNNDYPCLCDEEEPEQFYDEEKDDIISYNAYREHLRIEDPENPYNGNPEEKYVMREDEPHINEEDYDKWICDEKENCTGTRHCKGCY